jgi:two-component system LytT family response regulator
MTSPEAAQSALRVIVVEDEAAQRRQIVDWLAAEPGVVVVDEASDGNEAVAKIDAAHPDVVLLDISLPELSGLDVLRRVRQAPEVVFTTAHRDFAIDAFELGAVDYLLKPFGPDRLANALRRVRDHIERGSAEAPVPVLERYSSVSDDTRPIARVFVRDRGAIVPIPVEQIVRLEADGDYTAVVANGRRHLIGMTLTALHDRIGRADFVRVHRQHVINLAHVARFVPHDAGRLRIDFAGGGSVIASRGGSQILRGLAM